MRNSDERKMVLYQGGDSFAFEELYHLHSGKVCAYLKNHLGSLDELNDLVQQVFLKLHRNRYLYHPKYPFLPWLFLITRHVMIDYLRKHKTVPMEHGLLEAMVQNDTPSVESENVLATAIESLPESQREVLKLRFQDGLPFDEIAKRLKIQEPAARKRMSRGMLLLKNRKA